MYLNLGQWFSVHDLVRRGEQIQEGEAPEAWSRHKKIHRQELRHLQSGEHGTRDSELALEQINLISVHE